MTAGLAYFFVLFVIVFSLLTYAVRSLSLYELVRQEYGSSEAWLAWVPFANRYLYGILAGGKLGWIRHPGLVLILVTFLSYSMQLNCYNEPPLLFLSFVLLCFSYVLSSGLLYKIYSRYAPEKAEEYLFVSMVLPFASAYVLLKIAIRQMEIETEKSQEELPAAADPRAQYREYFTREIKKFTGNIKTYNLEKMTFGQPEEQDELPEIPKPTVKSFVEVEFEETEDIATEPEEQIPDIKEYQLQQIREELTRAVQKLR